VDIRDSEVGWKVPKVMKTINQMSNINFATTIPVLEDSTRGIDVVGGGDQVLHEPVLSGGRVHGTGGITGIN